MAGNTKDDPQKQQQNLELREALNDAYAAVESSKTTQSFSALTFEELADQQIRRISGGGVQSRPDALTRVQKVLNNLTQSVTKIKALPPEAFQESDDARDVNTPA